MLVNSNRKTKVASTYFIYSFRGPSNIPYIKNSLTCNKPKYYYFCCKTRFDHCDSPWPVGPG